MNLIYSIFFSNTKIIFKALFLAGPDEEIVGFNERMKNGPAGSVMKKSLHRK
ncbi:hypothetical protein [Staphylococcus phage LY01]|nr:hypothetical protein [Staphylococcus phage LY01]